MPSLTKNDIVEKIEKQSGAHKKQVTGTIENLLEIMKAALESGEDVMISGFGKFCVNEKAARKGRNPATGQSMTLQKRKVVTFKCSGKLRDRVNEHK
jgi:integration host factor subunit alpha